jgi:hypothetical protein
VLHNSFLSLDLPEIPCTFLDPSPIWAIARGLPAAGGASKQRRTLLRLHFVCDPSLLSLYLDSAGLVYSPTHSSLNLRISLPSLLIFFLSPNASPERPRLLRPSRILRLSPSQFTTHIATGPVAHASNSFATCSASQPRTVTAPANASGPRRETRWNQTKDLRNTRQILQTHSLP